MCMYSSMKQIERPYTLIEEDPQSRRASPLARVERMFEQIRAKLPSEPQFILCVLPERKNSDIYGKGSFVSCLQFSWPLTQFLKLAIKLLNLISCNFQDHGKRNV